MSAPAPDPETAHLWGVVMPKVADWYADQAHEARAAGTLDALDDWFFDDDLAVDDIYTLAVIEESCGLAAA